jgi:hypothetical protein
MSNETETDFASRVAGEVAFGPGEHAQKENAASAARLSKRVREMGKRVVLREATITRTKTGVVVESRGAGRPSNPQPTRNFFALADNAMYASIDEMYVSFVGHFTDEEGQQPCI